MTLPTEGSDVKGTLSLDQLYISGVKSYKNVNIEFDFSNSTFSLVNAIPADNSIPEQAIETKDAGGLSVGLRGCISKDKSVTCYLLLTSNEFDREIYMCGYQTAVFSSCRRESSTAFDNRGNQFFSSSVTVSNSEGTSFVKKKLIAGLATEATIVFEGLSTLSTGFPQLDLGFYADEKYHRVKFDNVAF